jgi:predicted RNA-binding Zn-ribbon protein involved in translation (DUF1610 family)
MLKRLNSLEVAAQYRSDIIGRLVASGAISLSDEEIARCTRDSAPAYVATWARMLRDAGHITMDDLRDALADTAVVGKCPNCEAIVRTIASFDWHTGRSYGTEYACDNYPMRCSYGAFVPATITRDESPFEESDDWDN